MNFQTKVDLTPGYFLEITNAIFFYKNSGKANFKKISNI